MGICVQVVSGATIDTSLLSLMTWQKREGEISMRLDEYLSKFAELKNLYEIVKQDFLAKGLVHHNWKHVQRDLARGIIKGHDMHPAKTITNCTQYIKL
jgi:hypothetical protein